jgi:c-di-GMP-binding flagellar brake protein YcgR
VDGDLSAESTRLIIRGLALEKARLHLVVGSLAPQPAVVAPELITAEGFSFVTLLRPESPTLWLPPDTRVTASGHLHGATVRLTCRLRGIVAGDREWQLQVGWPEEVHQVQRRLAFRAQVPMDHPSRQARLGQAGAEPVSADVLDLSLTGIGLKPPRSWRPDHDAPLQCTLPRPGGGTITGNLEIRHLSHAEKGLRLGAQFTAMDDTDRKALRTVIGELERMALKRRRTD